MVDVSLVHGISLRIGVRVSVFRHDVRVAVCAVEFGFAGECAFHFSLAELVENGCVNRKVSVEIIERLTGYAFDDAVYVQFFFFGLFFSVRFFILAAVGLFL